MNSSLFLPVLTSVASAALLSVVSGSVPAQAGVVSDPVTASKWTIPNGATFFSAPAHATPAFSGAVASVAGNVITVAGSPGWTVDQFGPQNTAGLDFYQYLAIVRSDASGEGAGTRGDWWLVDGNAAGTLTVLPDAFGATTTRVGAGDTLEVIKLVSIADIFGTGGSLRIGADSDFDDSTPDTIRVVVGTGFGAPMFYHDGSTGNPAGWYYDYAEADGALLTLYPDQAVMVFHAGAPTDVYATGVLQTYDICHYLSAGPNPRSTSFAAPAPIGTSGLKEAGFLDTDFDDSTPDTLRLVVGTGFGIPLFYHDGSSGNPAGWYADYAADETFPLAPGEGVMIFSDTPLVWRQPAPFVP